MTRLVLVRHAQSAPSPDAPEPDWPLSPLGEAQARDLIPVLRGLGVTALASSPYRRAIATLAPFAQESGLTIAVDEDLRERALSGGWLRDMAEVEAAVARMHADLDFCLEGGENGHQTLIRFRRGLDRVCAAAGEAVLAVGSHGGVLGHLLAVHHPDPAEGFWRSIRNPHIFVFDWSGEPRFIEEITLDGATCLGAMGVERRR